ncbi:Rsm22-domain-containing protein, partial [Obba rivulosa]
MLRTQYSRSLTVVARRHNQASFSSTSTALMHQPNAPLDLDPSFQALLKDADMSLRRHKSERPLNKEYAPRRELQVYPSEEPVADNYIPELDVEPQDGYTPRERRKSPAALLGSLQIGEVVLPFELKETITRLIAQSDKNMLHTDAMRLFAKDNGEDLDWNAAYDVRYKSRQQAARLAERDGTAFASVALPSHYAAICAVLDHVKRRLGPDLNITRVIDWGAGIGSGLWAASHTFQKGRDFYALPSDDDPRLSRSIFSSYVAIDQRPGLTKIGQKLLADVPVGDMEVSFQRNFRETNVVEREEGKGVLAMSAFMLSTLSTEHARKQLLKEMWESGAGMMVLIDHNTSLGFECIAEARQFLLRLGRKETEGLDAEDAIDRGSHVVAPCPHDGVCPLYQTGAMSKLVCGFEQRLKRPAFVRKTKHSRMGEEDVGYTYVVIRRGARPSRVDTKVGRVGEVGRRDLIEAVNLLPTEMSELEEVPTSADGRPSSDDNIKPELPGELHHPVEEDVALEPLVVRKEVDVILRREAYSWPRLIFPPIKNGGHIILDGCAAEGKIMRMIIPKSQGKQPYYDARKSAWGDLWPHDPKNAPQERHIPLRGKGRASAMGTANDIGKQGKQRSKEQVPGHSYTKIAGDVKRAGRERKQLRKLREHEDERWL